MKMTIYTSEQLEKMNDHKIGLQKDVLDYIKSLELDNLDWKSVADPTSDDVDKVLLITKWNNEQLGIEIGKAFGHSFAGTDDLGWVGPVKWVVAWAEIKI